MTAAQTSAWFSWYSLALVDAVSWQIDVLRAAGYTGRFHLPVAGRGVLPPDLKAAVNGHLDGRNDPDGALERGLHYPKQFALIAALNQRLSAGSPGQGVDIDFTGLDDDTAVRARRLNPPQDSCAPGDIEAVAAGKGGSGWSGQRWTIANARRAGLAVLGENPGPPHAAFTGGSKDSDGLPDQLAFGVRYAHACGLKSFLFAFENQLFEESGVSLDDYARAIESASGVPR